MPPLQDDLYDKRLQPSITLHLFVDDPERSCNYRRQLPYRHVPFRCNDPSTMPSYPQEGALSAPIGLIIGPTVGRPHQIKFNPPTISIHLMYSLRHHHCTVTARVSSTHLHMHRIIRLYNRSRIVVKNLVLGQAHLPVTQRFPAIPVSTFLLFRTVWAVCVVADKDKAEMVVLAIWLLYPGALGPFTRTGHGPCWKDAS